MYSSEQLNEILSNIGTTAGAEEGVMELLGNLRDDYEAARTEMETLRSANTPPDGYDTWQSAYSSVVTERDTMKAERDDARMRYVERFFGGDGSGKRDDPPDDDDKPASFESLFTNK